MKKFFIVVLLSCALFGAKAQSDPQFSQNMFNIPAINPAAIASDSSFTVYGIMRQQWVGLKNAPRTTVVNLNAPFLTFDRTQHAVGLMYINDRAGFFLNQMIYGQYAYRFRLKREGVLSFGTTVGALNQTVDPDVFIPENFEDSGFSSTDMALLREKGNGIAFDWHLGAFYSDASKYFGVSAQHLTKSVRQMDENIIYDTKTTTYFTAGYNFSLANPLYVLKPSVFVKTDFVSYQSDFNCLVEYDRKYWGGMGYRLDDAVVFIVGMQLANGLRFSYSYDWTTSKLGAVSNGSHEIMVGYSLKQDRKRTKYKSIRIL